MNEPIKTLETVMRELRQLSLPSAGISEYYTGVKVEAARAMAALQPVRDALWAAIERAESKTPCAEHYLCLLADVKAILGEREG